ncbi:MAG: Formate dehydrogenase [Betaproteobacteria bacterium]|nr:Formate dehydrogenase [Betaproteobacteria bacterium]
MDIHHSSSIRQPGSLLVVAAIALSLASILAGCGQQGSGMQKTPTRYQGKPDTAPWESSRWHDNRDNWERAITARAQDQNEYVRIPQ